MAWDYAYKGDAETAMKRFNQAWLLDTLNADAYWGFGILIGKDGKLDESIALFNKSLELNPVNSDVWYCLAVSHQGLYHKGQEDKHKEEMLRCLHKAIEINPNNYNAIRTLQQESKSEDNEIIIQSNPAR